MKLNRKKIETLVLLLFPFYLRPSGQPQLFDIFMTVIIVTSILTENFTVRLTKGNIILSIFVFVVVLTSIIRTIDYGNPIFMKFSAFYIYNFFVYLYYDFRLELYSMKDYKFMQKTLFFSSLIVFIITIIDFSTSGSARAVGTFNNPNQLSYFALLNSLLIFIVSYRISNFNYLFYFSILLSTFFNILSLSNAGIISQGVLLIIIIYVLVKNKTIKVRHVFLILLLSTIVLTIFFKKTDVYTSFILRMNKTSDKLGDSGSVRGYARILENPHYLILGSGEGINLRMGGTHEFHSTLGNLSLSYGIITLFLFLLFRLYSMNTLGLLFSLPILLYGLTHNGIRFTILWIVYALLNNQNKTEKLKSRNLNK